MGSFGDIKKTELQMEHDDGFVEGIQYPVDKLYFLKNTKIGVISSKIGGFIDRWTYRKLFNLVWKGKGGRQT